MHLERYQQCGLSMPSNVLFQLVYAGQYSHHRPAQVPEFSIITPTHPSRFIVVRKVFRRRVIDLRQIPDDSCTISEAFQNNG